MAKGYLSIIISSTYLRFVYFHKTFGGFQPVKAGEELFNINPTASGSLAKEIRELIKQYQLAPCRICVSLARPDILIRQVVMPKMSAAEISSAVGNEIRKNPYFSNRSFDFIHGVDPLSKEKSSVVYAAMDEALIKFIIDEVRALHIPFRDIDIVPLNLKKLILSSLKVSGPQAVLVVSDHQSYLAIFKNGNYELIYQTSTGTADLYEQKLEAMQRTVFNHFVGEIQRVFKAYQSGTQSGNIEKIWFVWNNVAIPPLAELLQQNLGVTVQPLSLKDIPGFKEGDQAAENPFFVVAGLPFFLELKGIKPQFPFSYFLRKIFLEQKLFILSLVSIAVTCLFGFFLFGKVEYYYKTEVEYEGKTSQLLIEIDALRQSSEAIYKERDEFVKMRQGLLDQAQYVSLLNRVSWGEVLSVVAEKMPEGLSLTEFRFDSGGNVSFSGDSLRVETIAELIRRVDRSGILTEGRFDQFIERAVQGQKIFSYTILAKQKRVDQDVQHKDNDTK